ncbi:MAG: GDSL-type esterase/lipase family protein [Bryobacteraceae bacterium]|nr:GDSL-type esterase/lipase family protein [Bryobacteraceae bacterium]MDW8379827.1 GDSL-type esterase/lipase family protein [Bryobacterales bacterium]
MLWPAKSLLTLITFCGLLLLTHLVPALKDYRLMDWRTVPSLLDFVSRTRSANPESDEQLRLRPDTDALRQSKYPIEDDHHDLDRFYQSLHRVEGGEGVVRILHYGDSPTTADMITGDVRALLQKRFGDAGHGFFLIAKPWAWYSHHGLEIHGDGWFIDPVNQSSVKDGLFGLGGVSFRGAAGSTATIVLKGGGHHVLEVAYLRQPGGGQFRVEAGGVPLGWVNTNSSELGSGFKEFQVDPAHREFTIRTLGGPVRIFGARLERKVPGVVYNSLGVNGAYVSVLARLMSETHWTEQLRHYRPDLVIINYGTNESAYPQFVDTASAKELREVVRRLRVAVPGASILLMSPMDRGQRMAGGEIGTVPTIPRLVAIQQRVAHETGSAFFNTFAAMGGVGTMGRWYEAEPRLVGADFMHPMPAGAKIVGGLLYQALMDGYVKYKLRLIQSQRLALNSSRPGPGGQ